MRRFPKSLWFFGAFALLFLIQLIPLVGIFLLFMMSWLWSMFLINAGFIGVAFEILTRRVHWAWLSLPLVWFGGYGTLMISENQAISRLESEIVDSNQATRIPLSSDTSLVLSKTDYIDVWQLMYDHDLGVLYGRSNDGQTAKEYRFSPLKSCETVDENQHYEDLQIAMVSKNYDWRDQPMAKPFCVLSFPASEPERRLFADISSTEGLKLGGVPYTITRLRVRFEGQAVLFRKASAEPLRWFPMPFIYCGDMLSGGGGTWVCGANFMRANSTPLKTGATTTETIQAALSRIIALKPRKRTEFTVNEIRQAEGRLDSIRQSVLTRQIAALDQAIRKATGDGNQLEVESLRLYPEQLLPRLPAMVAAIERDCLPEEPVRRSNAQQLMQLVRSLPLEAIKPFIARLNRVSEKDPWFAYDRPESAM
jgi:hypothetical protein